jgi:hypothetical protein
MNALEAPVLWGVCPSADRAEVEPLLAGVAGARVSRYHRYSASRPVRRSRCRRSLIASAALDAIRPDGRDVALIFPPGTGRD